ncbi:MAG: HAMP domain-containing sensor histidine kinase [Oscillospiraceae bacterium]|nr:HAMP domain-containing sensor histidine kinase [Oscillospiraceae bacterium]
MADEAKKSRIFHPLAMRIVCIEILAMLVCTIIISLISISMYKHSVFSSIGKNDGILAVNMLKCYKEENEEEQDSINWIPEGTAQELLDWNTEASHVLYFLFDTEGNCVICSKQVNCEKAKIHLDDSALQIMQKDGKYLSDTLAMLNPEENHPMISKGSVISFLEPDGTTTNYYLFSNTVTSVMDAFVIRIWMFGLLCCIVLSGILIGVTVFFLNRHQKPLEQMMRIAQQCAKGNYTEHLNPGRFEEPSYEAMTYSINELAYAAENAENQRKQFVSNVSHELRTPMTIISGYVDGMLDGTVPKNKRGQYLSIVSQEMQRLKILISSMLNLTRFDNGTIQIHYQLFPIQDLVFRTILMFESRLEKRHITLVGLDSEPVQVWGDPDLIGQVIYNLFENAVKFVNTGGTITFTFTEESKNTILTIRNTGAGISKEELPKIFERFYKSDDSRSHDKTGLGIGLDITKHIIRLHKAQIFVSSEEGEYTEFSIHLPKKEKLEVPHINHTEENPKETM